MKMLPSRSKVLSIAVAAILLSSLTRGQCGDANGATVAADLLVARPLGVAVTAVGAGLFFVSLPFVMITEAFSPGNIETAAKTLIVAPAKVTFQRPLGERE